MPVKQVAPKTITVDKSQAPINLDEGSDELEFFDGLSQEPKGDDWVLAMWRGTPFSQKGKHKQKVNGIEAVFPLNRLRLTPYYFVCSARNSGNVDFVEDHRVGAKNMKMVRNMPDFKIESVVPKQYNSKEKIMDYVEKIKKERGKTLELAVTQL